MKMSLTNKAYVICLLGMCANSRGKGNDHTSIVWREYIGGSRAYWLRVWASELDRSAFKLPVPPFPV